MALDGVAILVLIVFILTYVVISSEKVNRTATSLLGMGVVGVILVAAEAGTFESIVAHIEWHTVLFVTSMMIIVTVAASSGMFQFLAIEMTKPTRGKTRRLFVSFLLFVFFISLFLDTTSTMLIMAPLTIEICKALKMDFKPFLISEAITCNFASIPTIVGAVPNLVIAEKVAEIAFLDQGLMFTVMMPLSVILFLTSIPILVHYFDDQLKPGEEDLVNQLLLIDASYMIRSRKDFYLSIVAIFILIIGFTFGHNVGVNPSLIAIIVASVLLILSREWVDDILQKVNWSTVFFLIGLFGLVAALAITGVIAELGIAIGQLIEGSIVSAIGFMIWVPGILSAVIDNIPVSTVLAPIVADYAAANPLLPLALIFTVNIGGILLPIGSPANVLALAFSEKEHDPISFKDFVKIGTPLSFLLLVEGTVWFLLLSFENMIFIVVPAAIVVCITFLIISYYYPRIWNLEKLEDE